MFLAVIYTYTEEESELVFDLQDIDHYIGTNLFKSLILGTYVAFSTNTDISGFTIVIASGSIDYVWCKF